MADTETSDQPDGESAPRKQPKSREWALDVGARKSSVWFFRFIRRMIRMFIFPWLRVTSVGAHNLDLDGPVIIAPVHRSNLDAPIVASLGHRRTRALAKKSLFVNPIGAWVVAALGAIPIRRGEADRDAMRSARDLLERGEAMIVFPEGTRQSGPEVSGVFDGTAYLASKTRAPVVPVGIAGTERALPPGAKFIHRSRVVVVVGEPIRVPEGRMSRPAMHEFSLRISADLQKALDQANELAVST